MSTPSYLILGAVYFGIFVLTVLAYGRDRTLRFRDVLSFALWPLELLWPFFVAAVATAELCAVLTHRRFEGRGAKTEAAT